MIAAQASIAGRRSAMLLGYRRAEPTQLVLVLAMALAFATSALVTLAVDTLAMPLTGAAPAIGPLPSALSASSSTAPASPMPAMPAVADVERPAIATIRPQRMAPLHDPRGESQHSASRPKPAAGYGQSLSVPVRLASAIPLGTGDPCAVFKDCGHSLDPGTVR